MNLLEGGPKDLVELTTWAQKNLIAHKQQLGGKSKTTAQKKLTQSKPDLSHGSQRSLQCYSCTKTSPGKHQNGSSTPVSQSGQKKTRAMVAQSCENDEEALMCLERTSSKRTLKKSGTDGSTNNGVGKLNGRPAKII